MTEISAEQVRRLRQSSGAGIMDCKKALMEAEGEMEDALDLLRVWGRSDAEEVSEREAAEGRIAVLDMSNESTASSIFAEFNCETDFVARNDEFIAFTKDILEKMANPHAPPSFPLDEFYAPELAEIISKVGENVKINRMSFNSHTSSVQGLYEHMGNQIASAVFLSLEEEDTPLTEWDPEIREQAEEIASNLAMHVAAMNPTYVDESSINAEELEEQRTLFQERALEQNKPSHIIDRIVEGQLAKWKKEQTLAGQSFVRNPDLTVAEYLESFDTKFKIISITRFEVGEGV